MSLEEKLEEVSLEEKQETLRTPSTPSATTAPSTLDSLFSPTDATKTFPIRESVAVSDTTEDETRFSSFSDVALSSARQSGASFTSVSSDPAQESQRKTVMFTPDVMADLNNHLEGSSKHKKSASTSTILSAANVQINSARSSLDSARAVQEEFSRRQSEVQDQGEQVESEENTIDWDFWGEVVSDYQKFASEHGEELAKAIENGIPKTLRGMIWQLMTASKDPELENTYLRLLKETSQHEKAITLDLGRTFPNHTFFSACGIGQENLFHVLKAYSIYDPQVGYCQGLPFVVAILLLQMPDEEAFCLLVQLMGSYDLRGHFLPDMPKLQLRLFQFERLTEEMTPVIHVHFLRQGIKSNMYCSQWFLTMFSYKFPTEMVLRIFDNCFANGIEALFAFSIALLLKNEETLLSLKFDELLAFLNSRIYEIYKLPGFGKSETKYDADQFVQDAMSMKITPFMLDSYAQEYDDFVRTRDAHAIEMDALRNSNRNLSAQVNRFEKSLAQLNTEHCEVLNELVRARLKHEELESELVRYKLLYAEAMHQSEDAMSSHRLSTISRRSRES